MNCSLLVERIGATLFSHLVPVIVYTLKILFHYRSYISHSKKRKTQMRSPYISSHQREPLLNSSMVASRVPAILKVTLPTCALQLISFLLGVWLRAVKSDISN